MGLCGIAGLIVPSLLLTFLGVPFGPLLPLGITLSGIPLVPVGTTVSGGDVCRLITLPRTVQCALENGDCYRLHSYGLIPDALANILVPPNNQ